MLNLKKCFSLLFLTPLFYLILAQNKLQLPLAKIWEVSLAKETEAIVLPPIADCQRIYGAAKNGTVYAISPTGETIWEYNAGEGISLPCFLAQGLLIVLFPSGKIISLNTETGGVVWQKSFAKAITSGAVSDKGTVFIGLKSGKLLALDPISGRKFWSLSAEGNVVAPPAVTKDKLFFGTDKGNLYAISAEKGDIIWKISIPGELRAPILHSGNRLFFGSTSDYFYAVDDTSGKIKWKFRTGGDIITRAVAFKDYVFVCSLDSSLYCFSKKRGHLIYRKDLLSRPYLDLISASGLLFLSPFGSKIMVFEPASGIIKSRLEVDGLITTSPLYAHGLIIVGTNKGKLIAFGEKKSKEGPLQEDSSPQQWRRW